MSRRACIAALVALSSSSCAPHQPAGKACADPLEGFEARNLAALDARPEAREWLHGIGSVAGLASNRFQSTDAALAFVEQLYAAGALRVVVGEVVTYDPGPNPYVDELIVRLPPAAEQRRALFDIDRQEATPEGFLPDCDVGQKTLLFWWD